MHSIRNGSSNIEDVINEKDTKKCSLGTQKVQEEEDFNILTYFVSQLCDPSLKPSSSDVGVILISCDSGNTPHVLPEIICSLNVGGQESAGTGGYTSIPVKYWWPAVDSAITPAIGYRFKTLAEGVYFYINYARTCGFSVPHGTLKRGRDGQLTSRYLLCSREGVKGGGQNPPKPVVGGSGGSITQRRKRVSNRVNCNARICIIKDKGVGFIVSIFVPEHTHRMCSEPSKLFMRINRKLDVAQQAFLTNCVKANVGGSKGFRLYKESVGSYANVGATDTEFHNFKRDLQSYIHDKDGEMIIAKFKQRCDICENFFFDHYLDEENHLARVFWADHTRRQSFMSFGDVISFDATYGTNRYSLVFVPFTGVDHHKRCITFACGLLTREDTESYVWVLERFKAAMGKSPLCVVTDQDPAMKSAIAQILPECRHRYCMWHIMTKVSEKSGVELSKDQTFRTQLNNIVWNETIGISDFETQWQSLMEKYNLTGRRWFIKLYTERAFWIPSYFLDLPMSGVLRTTSHSESENNAYGKSTRPHCSLVEFYVQYESVLETQRHKQCKLNAESEGSLPEFKTPLALERHIAQVFTLTVFYELQLEIEAACFYCKVVGIRADGECIRYDIKGEYNVIHTVEYMPSLTIASCSCKLFERLGLVCRHMFLVFKDAEMASLPARYIAARWCKQEGLANWCAQCSYCPPLESGPNRLWTEIHRCTAMVGSNTVRQTRMLQVIEELRDEFLSDGMSVNPPKGKGVAIAALCGVEPPTSITIKPPAQAKNKGTGKRIKSQRELAIERSGKACRKCGVCGEYAHHNARSCPLKRSVHPDGPLY
ncbi:PREDICTED: protein FAR1-RELATED SEQUENCE 5-like [Ipomoea nil]|uniref:protein FAR1-RELATED SEQUENCE 5-like n=1 Tax=Ipomoea nil TaxID=35883 RepID=UPI000901EF01|nr:PREDICTED: protein FAR1-RELATED SEQUENCE 5-like [Ipomoea nil]